MTAVKERIVVAGAGLAGLRAAERLRELGFCGDLIIVGDERHYPYHRPALSKHQLTGRGAHRDQSLAWYSDLGDCWRLGTRVERLDPRSHTVFLPGGEELAYDGLVIATGVQPRHLAGAPRRDPRVHVLRTLEDAQALRSTIAATRGRILVFGTGFTGCEIASSARQLDRKVTIVGRSDKLLANVLGDDCGTVITEFHRRNGTDLALGVTPVRWHRTPDHVVVELSDGQVLFGTCVVLAVGSVFNTGWLAGSGIDTTNGVLCDPACFVEGFDDIVAAGDVARWPNLRFDSTPRGCQHWLNAVEMGRAAAENLLAGRALATPYCPLPRFWSEQYGVRLQGIGLPALATSSRPIAIGVRPLERSLFAYFEKGRQVGAVALEQPRELLELSYALAEELPVPGSGSATPEHHTTRALPDLHHMAPLPRIPHEPPPQPAAAT